MQIDGVKVTLRKADGEPGKSVEFTKDVIGAQMDDNGGLSILSGLSEMDEHGHVQVRAYPRKSFAPGTWYSSEPINPRPDSTPRLVVPKPDLRNLKKVNSDG